MMADDVEITEDILPHQREEYDRNPAVKHVGKAAKKAERDAEKFEEAQASPRPVKAKPAKDVKEK